MKAVNLIPRERRPIGSSAVPSAAASDAGAQPIGAYAVLGVLAFAVVAVALMVLAGNDITKNKSELATVTQQAQAIESQASTMQHFADFKELSKARVDTVKGLADARFPWPETLDDVSRALPPNVFIDSFDGSTTGGGSGSGLRGAISAPSIELTGCTSDQPSVARLMSRLRDVRGVTRVTLAKSAKTETTSTAGASAAAPAAAADGSTPTISTEPCPKGEPPTFDVIVFFERATPSPNAAANSSIVSGPTGAAGAVAAVAGPTGAAGPTGTAGATTPTSSTTTTTP